MAEVALGELVEAVRPTAAVERVGEQHRIVDGRDADAVARHDEAVEFDVVPDLDRRGVLQQRLHQGERLGQGIWPGRSSLPPNRSPAPPRCASGT